MALLIRFCIFYVQSEQLLLARATSCQTCLPQAPFLVQTIIVATGVWYADPADMTRVLTFVILTHVEWQRPPLLWLTPSPHEITNQLRSFVQLKHQRPQHLQILITGHPSMTWLCGTRPVHPFPTGIIEIQKFLQNEEDWSAY